MDYSEDVITAPNIIVSIITFLIGVIAFIVSLCMGYYIAATCYLVTTIYILLWAYLGRYIGIKKGIETGYIWGYCLGFIGFIVVCILPEKNSNNQVYNTNKYENLETLHKLKESGAITTEEYEHEKLKVWNSDNTISFLNQSDRIVLPIVHTRDREKVEITDGKEEAINFAIEEFDLNQKVIKVYSGFRNITNCDRKDVTYKEFTTYFQIIITGIVGGFLDEYNEIHKRKNFAITYEVSKDYKTIITKEIDID